jgi:hypothetical protein
MISSPGQRILDASTQTLLCVTMTSETSKCEFAVRTLLR